MGSNNFFDLPLEEQSDLIKMASEQFGMSNVVIEKDIWICWVLEKIFELPIQMAFKGGTSLSKVFGLIKRFSEDCDVTIDYRNFKPELYLNQSKSQLKKISNELKDQLKNIVAETVMPYLKEKALKTFPEKSFEITLSEDGEQLKFYYPSLLKIQQNYLRDHVLIEFGVRNNIEPCEKHLISPYVSQITDNTLAFPQLMIETLSPLRTFWEKATLIHVECHRNRLDQVPERLSRHWYDLHMLTNSWVGEKALFNREILENVIEHKKAFFNANYANYDDCLSGKLRLIPPESYLNNLENDFNKMIDATMFYGVPPKFENVIKTLGKLEKNINEVSEFIQNLGKNRTHTEINHKDNQESPDLNLEAQVPLKKNNSLKNSKFYRK